MSQYTRKQVIDMVTRGESLACADLSGLDLANIDFADNFYGGRCEKPADFRGTNLSGADLSNACLGGADFSYAELKDVNLRNADLTQANLYGTKLVSAKLMECCLNYVVLDRADLSKANLTNAEFGLARLYMSKLSGANLKGADLGSADCEYADLTNTDISGANIYHIKTHGWEIEGIKCTHIYQCPSYQIWKDIKKREEHRRSLAPNEFEALFKTMPTIEIIFKNGFSPLDYMKLISLSERINQQRPEIKLEMKVMKKVGLDTILRFVLGCNENLEETACLIARLFKERNISQKLLAILEKEGVPLTTYSKPIYQGCTFNIIRTTGETINLGDITKIEQLNQSYSSVAIVNHYNTHKVEIDSLLANLRLELQQDKQELLNSLLGAIRANNQYQAASIWDMIRDGIDTTDKAYTLLKALAKFLGLVL